MNGMKNNLQDILPRFGSLLLACSTCLALLSVSREARGQWIVTREAGSSVSVLRPIEPRQRTLRQNVSLSESDRSDVAELASTKPTIDLEIRFDPDSAIIAPLARPSLDALGRALSDPTLKDQIFVIAGHTDSLEEEAYSQRLAERRAEAIKRELTKSFNIPRENLVVVGYGSSKLKVTMNPFDLQNNRVQVLNMEVKKH